MPRRFARTLTSHNVSTASELGWGRLKNGSLMSTAAEAGFEALITVDKRIRYEQNLAKLLLRIVVMVSPSNDIDDLARLAPRVLKALAEMPPRTLVEVVAGPHSAS